MAIFEWDDSIALNIPVIDEQHKGLIDMINMLHDALQKNETDRVIDEIFQKLILYVLEHFSEEERLMLSCRFPHYASHRQEHDQFVNRLKTIQIEFLDGEALGQETLDFLVDWLICHIKGTDQMYRRFIQGEPA